MPDMIKTPWTDEQVANLNRWQTCGHVHEFTCPNHHDGSRVLIARNDGWHCPNCPYTQTWAHAMMTLGPPPNPLQPILDAPTVHQNAERIFDANKTARDRGLLSIWTVFDHPKDYPDSFVARRFETGKGLPGPVVTDDAITGELASIRKSMELCGLYRMARAPSDDSKIVETWL